MSRCSNGGERLVIKRLLGERNKEEKSMLCYQGINIVSCKAIV